MPDGYFLYRPAPANNVAPAIVTQLTSLSAELPPEQPQPLFDASETDTVPESDGILSPEPEDEGKDAAVLISLLSWGNDFDRPFASRSRRSDMPHKLMERLLATGGPARWGILCNGRRIRLLKRDVVAGRQQYFEVDLEALFDNRNEQDANLKEQGFDTFWTLFRAQAFQPGADGRCLLDILEQESRKHAEGVSARLKTSVFQALDTLMSELVNRAHALSTRPPTQEDSALDFSEQVRQQRASELAEQALKELPTLYTQSLVYLYRLLFVLYAESRNLLPNDNAVYRDAYSLEPLRAEIELPGAETRYRPDSFRLWETLQALFRLIHRGCNTTQLVVPAYNGNLFDPRSVALLHAIRISDDALYRMLLPLSVTPPTKNRGRERIDYRDLVSYIREQFHEGLGQIFKIDPDPYFAEVREIVKEVRPFHWELEFPEIYFEPDGRARVNPGFSAVLGNPPWDGVKPNFREFFATYDPGFRELERVAADDRQAELLEDQKIDTAWQEHVKELDNQIDLFRLSDIYQYQSVAIDGKQTGGDANTYKFFLERANWLLARHGKAAQIVKADVYKGQGATGLRQMLLHHGSFDFLYALSNEKRIFPSIHHAERFALVGFTKSNAHSFIQVGFAITIREAIPPVSLSSYLTDPEKIMDVPGSLIERMSPDTLSIMEFRSQHDVDIVAQIYGNWPLLGETIPNAWSIAFTREFDMTNDRGLFNTEHKGWPLYEGKLIHQYTHRFSEPRYWVEPEKGREELARMEIQRVEEALDTIALKQSLIRKVATRKERVKNLLASYGRGPLTADDVKIAPEAPRLAFRDVAANTNERTMITTIIPTSVFVGNTLNYIIPWHFNALKALKNLDDIKSYYEPMLPVSALMYLCGVFNSFALDYVIRFKVSNHVNIFYAYQLPVPRLTPDDPHCRAIAHRVAQLVCIGSEFDALRQELLGAVTAHVATIQDERRHLQNEIDALVAHLYGLRREDLEHILYAPYTFPLVKREVKDGVMAAFERVEELLITEMRG